MPWVNYHSHSLFCDGKAAPRKFAESALLRKFPAYGFSSHAPVPFDSPWNMAPDNLPSYLDSIAQIRTEYAGKLDIYTGLETDYIDGYWNFQMSGLKNLPLHYRIGSVHYLGKFPEGSFFCFDGQSDAFFEGVERLYQNDFRKLIKDYYLAIMHMAEADCPDIIGHLDKIKMHTTVKPYVTETEKWYTGLVNETLDVIKRQGCMVEINTRGLYKHHPPLLYPGVSIIKQLKEKKIPVVMNSDAHHPDEIELGFRETATLLLEAGIRTLRVLRNGEWEEVPFTSEGLLL